MLPGHRSAGRKGLMIMALMGLLSFSTLPFVAAILDDSVNIVTWLSSLGAGAEEEEEKKSGEDQDDQIPGRVHGALATPEDEAIPHSGCLASAYLFHPETSTPPPEGMMMRWPGKAS